MLKISDFTDMQEFERIMSNWAEATGLASVAVDADGKYISECYNFTDFCMQLTRGSVEGCRRCEKCDREGEGVYRCHAGLVDFAFPIMVAGEKLGSIIGGQVLPAPPDDEAIRRTARELGIDEDEYVEAAHRVSIRKEATINAAAELLNQVINHFVTASYQQYRDEGIINRLKDGTKKNNELTDSVKGKIADLKRIQSKQKILALNAKIEAARAGDAGSGFAVVADQVGSLSSVCAGTYGEIEGLINSMAETVENMQEGL